jgi:hypothetical protein
MPYRIVARSDIECRAVGYYCPLCGGQWNTTKDRAWKCSVCGVLIECVDCALELRVPDRLLSRLMAAVLSGKITAKVDHVD